MRTVTEEWINANRTDLGAWTLLQFKALGIDWPPRSGWKEKVLGSDITDEAAHAFEIGRTHHAQSTIKRKANAALRAEGLLPPLPVKGQPLAPKLSKKARKKQARAAKALALQIKLADTSRKPVYTGPTQKKKKAPAAPLTVEGVDVRSKEFLQTWTWRELRYKTLQRYGRACLCCGASPQTGAVIHVDHIKPRSLFPELAMDPDNLQTLCADCNVGKSNKDMTDWREPDPEPSS